jgi:hypothetical protein
MPQDILVGNPDVTRCSNKNVAVRVRFKGWHYRQNRFVAPRLSRAGNVDVAH